MIRVVSNKNFQAQIKKLMNDLARRFPEDTVVQFNYLPSSDYSPALPYRVLASLFSHMGDFRAALDSLQKARQADPAGADAAAIDKDIENLQPYVGKSKESR
jgi:hypothetical protein